MKKTVITALAFLVLFGFTITGAMAQTWTWQYAEVTSPLNISKLTINPATNDLYGLSGDTVEAIVLGEVGPVATPLTNPATSGFIDIASGYQGAVYAITSNSVASCIPGEGCSLIDTQPDVPTETTGTFTDIAAGKNGKLFVLYDDNGTQYVLTGNPPIAEGLVVKLNPQSLNLGSKGNWVTCLIEIPGYDINGINQAEVAITNFRIDTTDYPVNIPVAANAPYDFETNKLMVKFLRYNKTAADDPESMVGALSAILPSGPSKGKVDVTATIQATHTDGTFSGEAMFQAIVPKAKKQK